MIRKNKGMKGISIALSCMMLVTATPIDAFATERGIEQRSGVPADVIIRNDETGIPDWKLYAEVIK